MKTYAYLISDRKKVPITFEKPKSVRIGKKNWKERFRLPIGQCITVYTDDPWMGVIGVYDTSDKDQMVRMAIDIGNHSMYLAHRNIENGLHRLFGRDASDEVCGYKWAFDAERQRNHRWSPLAELLWNIEQILNIEHQKFG